jgi:hypothetical protein
LPHPVLVAITFPDESYRVSVGVTRVRPFSAASLAANPGPTALMSTVWEVLPIVQNPATSTSLPVPTNARVEMLIRFDAGVPV